MDSDTSRYVTVYHQLKETETGEPGDRFIIHGEHYGDSEEQLSEVEE